MSINIKFFLENKTIDEVEKQKLAFILFFIRLTDIETTIYLTIKNEKKGLEAVNSLKHSTIRFDRSVRKSEPRFYLICWVVTVFSDIALLYICHSRHY